MPSSTFLLSERISQAWVATPLRRVRAVVPSLIQETVQST